MYKLVNGGSIKGGGSGGRPVNLGVARIEAKTCPNHRWKLKMNIRENPHAGKTFSRF